MKIYEIFGKNWNKKFENFEFAMRSAGIFLSRFYQSPKYNDQNSIITFQGHFPNGASAKQTQHFIQLLNQNSLIEFNHGNIEDNLKKCGSANPNILSLNNLKNIDSPEIYILTGRHDNLVNEMQIKELIVKDLKFEDGIIES